MKKMIISAMMAALCYASYAITAEEAIASRNMQTIKEYCSTNKINTFKFLYVSNNLPHDAYVDIIKSITFKDNIGYLIALINKFNDTNDISLYTSYSNYKEIEHMTLKFNDRCISRYRTKKSSVRAIDIFYVEHLAPNVIKYSSDMKAVADIAIKYSSALKDNSFVTAAKQRFVREDYASGLLDIAIYERNVDAIIDALLKMDNTITAKQVSGIIEPINAVEAEYRKADIVKALSNVNSWCTIRLYDDQKTWEPLLAKVRAMISLRK